MRRRRGPDAHTGGPAPTREQIGVAGLLAAGGDQRVRLAAVMGLVIEEMRHQEAPRLAQLLLRRGTEPDLILGQPVIGDAPGPGRNPRVGIGAQPPQARRNRRSAPRSPSGSPSGFGQPSNRDIHIWSPQSRWHSVPCSEPQNAPRSLPPLADRRCAPPRHRAAGSSRRCRPPWCGHRPA